MKKLTFSLPAAIIASTLLYCSSLLAQEKAKLYAGLSNSKGYVVGAKLSPSGLHVFEGDTTWRLIGWKHPRISAVAFDPNDRNIIYLAGGNGCLKSKDGGKSWKLTTDWQVTESQSICVDPNAPQNVYISTAYGIWRSRDYGQSWQAANNGLPKKYTQFVTADRQEAGRLFAATEGGIFVTTDGGDTWRLAGAEGIQSHDIQQSVKDPQIWLAATETKGIFHSKDNGKSWKAVGGEASQSPIYGVAIDPFDTQNMAAAGWNSGVLISRDGGKTWQSHRDGLPVDDFYSLTFDANSPGHLWVATIEEGIFKSPDFGKSWEFKGMYGSLVFDLVFY